MVQKTGNQSKIENPEVVIITDHTKLTNTFIDWLSDFNLALNFYNGDHAELNFLEIMQPALIIFDPGFKKVKEDMLLEKLKTGVVSSRCIILTYKDTKQYQRLVNKSNIACTILHWKNYKQLPLIMNKILGTNTNHRFDKTQKNSYPLKI